jgi:hypothetical protein
MICAQVTTQLIARMSGRDASTLWPAARVAPALSACDVSTPPLEAKRYAATHTGIAKISVVAKRVG